MRLNWKELDKSTKVHVLDNATDAIMKALFAGCCRLTWVARQDSCTWYTHQVRDGVPT